MYINRSHDSKFSQHRRRMQDTRLPKKIFTLELTGRRPIGRPRTRWRDQVKQDLERRGLSWTEVTSKSLLFQITVIRKLNSPYSKYMTPVGNKETLSRYHNQLNVNYECFGTKFNYNNLRNFKS